MTPSPPPRSRLSKPQPTWIHYQRCCPARRRQQASSPPLLLMKDWPPPLLLFNSLPENTKQEVAEPASPPPAAAAVRSASRETTTGSSAWDQPSLRSDSAIVKAACRPGNGKAAITEQGVITTAATSASQDSAAATRPEPQTAKTAGAAPVQVAVAAPAARSVARTAALLRSALRAEEMASKAATVAALSGGDEKSATAATPGFIDYLLVTVSQRPYHIIRETSVEEKGTYITGGASLVRGLAKTKGGSYYRDVRFAKVAVAHIQPDLARAWVHKFGWRFRNKAVATVVDPLKEKRRDIYAWGYRKEREQKVYGLGVWQEDCNLREGIKGKVAQFLIDEHDCLPFQWMLLLWQGVDVMGIGNWFGSSALEPGELRSYGDLESPLSYKLYKTGKMYLKYAPWAMDEERDDGDMGRLGYVDVVHITTHDGTSVWGDDCESCGQLLLILFFCSCATRKKIARLGYDGSRAYLSAFDVDIRVSEVSGSTRVSTFSINCCGKRFEFLLRAILGAWNEAKGGHYPDGFATELRPWDIWPHIYAWKVTRRREQILREMDGGLISLMEHLVWVGNVKTRVITEFPKLKSVEDRFKWVEFTQENEYCNDLLLLTTCLELAVAANEWGTYVDITRCRLFRVIYLAYDVFIYGIYRDDGETLPVIGALYSRTMNMGVSVYELQLARPYLSKHCVAITPGPFELIQVNTASWPLGFVLAKLILEMLDRYVRSQYPGGGQNDETKREFTQFSQKEEPCVKVALVHVTYKVECVALVLVSSSSLPSINIRATWAKLDNIITESQGLRDIDGRMRKDQGVGGGVAPLQKEDEARSGGKQVDWEAFLEGVFMATTLDLTSCPTLLITVCFHSYVSTSELASWFGCNLEVKVGLKREGMIEAR